MWLLAAAAAPSPQRLHPKLAPGTCTGKRSAGCFPLDASIKGALPTSARRCFLLTLLLLLLLACLQGAVAGDVDGDGLLEIVFGTLDGRVHAIRGTDGSPIPNFPFQTGFRVQAQPTIAPLDPHNPNVQHILVMSFDGFLYAISGKSGCAHAVDIGENSYSAVLVDDLCGDGNLELLVSTMNGNVYMLQTQAPYHPLKTWTAQVRVEG